MLAAVAAGLACGVAAVAAAQTPTAPAPPAAKVVPLPSNLAPASMGSVGITVADLDKMGDFYTQMFGFKVIRTLSREGAIYEYILNVKTDGTGGSNLVLLKGTRQPGATTYGRIILYVPDADGAAKFLTENGWPARKVADLAYFLRDPEGNNVEIYTPEALRKK